MTTKTKNIILVTLTLIIASVIPALLLGKYVEAIIFIACHWLIRPQFSKEYHHIIPAICRIITASVMFFGVCIILPTKWSALSAIPINYLMSWVGYIKKDRDDLEVKCDRQHDKISELLILCDDPKDKLVKKCRELNINERNTRIAVMYYIDKKTPKQIWGWLCDNNEYMEYDSVYKLLNRLNKKLK